MGKLNICIKKETSVPPSIPNIFAAAESNDVNGLEVALEYYDVNELDDVGMTPLHYAASALSLDTMRRLLLVPDINATLADKFGRSAVTLAFECWHSMADSLIDELNPHCYPWLYSSNDIK